MVSKYPRHGHFDRKLNFFAHRHLQKKFSVPQLGQLAAFLQSFWKVKKCNTFKTWWLIFQIQYNLDYKCSLKSYSWIPASFSEINNNHFKLNKPLNLSRYDQKNDILWKLSIASKCCTSISFRNVFFPPLLSAISDSNIVLTIYNWIITQKLLCKFSSSDF